jgi:hypothetical protein
MAFAGKRLTFPDCRALSRLAGRHRNRLDAGMYPSPRFILTALLLLAPALTRAAAPATDMLNAATALLAALTPDQKKQATFELTSEERENWFFTPVPRQGLPLKQMDARQQGLARALLRTGLSHTGSARADAIMSLELVLREIESAAQPTKRDAVALRRDPVLYYVTIFGTPAADKPWGWRWEGHHLSFNFTVAEGSRVAFVPAFMGSNPAEVRSGPRTGERILGEEEDLGRALVKALDAAQLKVALVEEKAPNDMITSNKKMIDPLSPAGLMADQMTSAQRERLMAVVRAYVSRNRAELADATMQRINSEGINRISFAWAGGLERGDAHYYRVQGPSFLIEFDNTQNQANHIHSVFREFKGDFGRDLLREHYQKSHKH